MSRRFLPLASILFLVVGCSETPTGINSVEIPAPTTEALRLVFPFDSYVLSDSETHVTYEAGDVLMRSCMRQQGHDWKIVRTPKGFTDWRNRLHYGLIEPSVAARFGYHVPSDLQAPPEVREVLAKIKTRQAALTKDEAQAAQKCRKAADGQLTRNAKAPFAPFNDFKSKTYDEAQREPAVRRAMAAWSACMRDKNFSYPTPIAAGEDSAWWAKDTREASAKEIVTAKADVACKKKTGLVSRWFDTERSLEQETIRSNQEYFTKLKAANDRYLENARRVLREQ
ncbi:hypothetical protein [Streptomyces sp. L-9-10]|uniref:hypothetical protein n=1 Tax=Streptomyces sp. L-9-10 TaxID=1478131 RepID=UPI00101B9166|nr:hypothetical protein [Streptomyces sp. L-9-10]